jgi:DNA invertase Pin-like site-specific DNA recombinase
MNQLLPEECLGYCRVSTNQQDLSRQREQILTYTNSNNMSLKSFIETKASADKRAARRSIDELYQQIETTGIKTLIVAELSRLGRSVGQLLRTVEEIVQDRGCRLIVIQEKFDFRPGKELDMSSEVTLTLFSLLARIERRLISERTKAGLAARKAQGVKLGRPKGKSKLDDHKERIFEYRALGVPIKKCAEHLKCQTSTMSGWLKKHRTEFKQWKIQRNKQDE